MKQGDLLPHPTNPEEIPDDYMVIRVSDHEVICLDMTDYLCWRWQMTFHGVVVHFREPRREKSPTGEIIEADWVPEAITIYSPPPEVAKHLRGRW